MNQHHWFEVGTQHRWVRLAEEQRHNSWNHCVTFSKNNLVKDSPLQTVNTWIFEEVFNYFCVSLCESHLNLARIYLSQGFGNYFWKYWDKESQNENYEGLIGALLEPCSSGGGGGVCVYMCQCVSTCGCAAASLVAPAGASWWSSWAQELPWCLTLSMYVLMHQAWTTASKGKMKVSTHPLFWTTACMFAQAAQLCCFHQIRQSSQPDCVHSSLQVPNCVQMLAPLANTIFWLFCCLSPCCSCSAPQ